VRGWGSLRDGGAFIATKWHKLIMASVLPQSLFPEGFARIRKPLALVSHAGSYAPSDTTSASCSLVFTFRRPRTAQGLFTGGGDLPAAALLTMTISLSCGLRCWPSALGGRRGLAGNED
jgi:hypothetical protein